MPSSPKPCETHSNTPTPKQSRSLGLSTATEVPWWSPTTAGASILTHTPKGHFGLIGMKERGAGIDAEVAVESSPTGGTTVTVSWGQGGQLK